MPHIMNTIRIDKNVGKNILDFSSLGKDAPLVKSLIYYFCQTYQHNLFYLATIDPDNFGQQFNFSTNYLRSVHEDPAQLKGLTPEQVAAKYHEQTLYPERRVWDSNLENALYILATTQINYSYGGKVFDPESKDETFYSEIKSMQFINELRVVFKKNSHGGKDKVYYTYELDPRFLENLTEFYYKADTESLCKLRKPALDDLYIYIKFLADRMAPGEKATPHFSLLCKLAHINLKDASKRKYKLTSDIKRIRRESNLDFELMWVKESSRSRYAYQPVLTFSGAKASQEEKAHERLDIFYQRLSHELLNSYRRKHMRGPLDTLNEAEFIRWCKNTGTDKEEKVLSFQYAYFKTWRSAVETNGYSVRKFLEQLPLISNLKDIYRIQYRYLTD